MCRTTNRTSGVWAMGFDGCGSRHLVPDADPYAWVYTLDCNKYRLILCGVLLYVIDYRIRNLQPIPNTVAFGAVTWTLLAIINSFYKQPFGTHCGCLVVRSVPSSWTGWDQGRRSRGRGLGEGSWAPHLL